MISRKEILLLVSLASIAMLPLSICQPAEPLNCPRLGFETGTMPMNGKLNLVPMAMVKLDKCTSVDAYSIIFYGQYHS